MKRGVVVRTCAVAAFLAMSASAEAQRSRGPGGFVGVSFVAADPVGPFGNFVDQGFGAQFEGGVPVLAGGLLRLRGDLGFLVYGHETLYYCGFSCRVGSDLTTTNSIIYGGVGPELALGAGPIQPYVHATAGLAGFVTSSSLNDRDGYGDYFETTNHSDVVMSYKFGGGLRLRVSRGFKPVYIDFGVERHVNGVAEFLTEGDIVDNSDGSITVFPNLSEADLMTYRVGISFGFPGGDRERSRRRRR